MTWLMLTYILSVGTIDNQLTIESPNSILDFSTPKGAYETTLGVEALIAEHFFIGGSVVTWEKLGKWKNGMFAPIESLYKFDAGIRWNGFEFRFSHECDHVTLPKTFKPMLSTVYGMQRTEFTVSYTGKLTIF